MSAAKSKREKPPELDLLILAFEMIAEEGWPGLSFSGLAARAGVPLAEVRRQFGSRTGLLAALSRRLDEAMLSIEREELGELPVRDRIFELIMRRLEAMAPFRGGLLRLGRDGRQDIELLLATVCRLDRSIAWLQDAAGLCTVGLRARLGRRVLTAVYLRTLHIWSKDVSPDLAKTMASLDQLLRRVESVASFVGAGPRKARPEPAADPL